MMEGCENGVLTAEMRAFEDDFQVWRKAWIMSLQDDFGQLSYYRNANARLGPPSPGEERIVFFGDSIIEGWRLEDHFPARHTINRGIGGQTTSQMLIRFRQDTVALKPTAVVIHAGTNDIGGNTGLIALADIQANLASMADIAGANGVQVVFSSILPAPVECTPIYRYNFFKHPPEKTRALNSWVRDYSAAHDCRFVDYSEAVTGGAGRLKPAFSEDGLHPTAAGYAAMAPLVQAAIDAALVRC